MRVITFDIEIQRDPQGDWEAARRGASGCSCVALYDTASGRLHVYDEHDLAECVAHLNDADVLVGFNTMEFDTPILESLVQLDILPEQYDVLHEIWKAMPERTAGYKLQQICERHNLGGKNNDGAKATELYANGRFGKLFDYCMNDVHLTRKLVQYIEIHGGISTPDGGFLELPRLGVGV